jgi:broad specificity phosphatase PhoE
MKEIELRRHSLWDKEVDTLNNEGRQLAKSIGRGMPKDFVLAFSSTAQRAAETVANLLRGSRQGFLPSEHEEGLASQREDEWRAASKAAGSSRLDALMEANPRLVQEESTRLAEAIRELFGQVPEGARALAVGHSPLIEAAVYGLTGAIVEPLASCEGVHITQGDDGEYRIQELRREPAEP